MFKIVWVFLIAASLLAFPNEARAKNQTSAVTTEVAKDNPFELVRDVSDALFKRITREQETIQKDAEILRTIVAEQLAPSINHKYAAAMVMGRYFNQYTPEQRERFYEAFQKYLVATYAGILTLYDDQEVVFEPGYPIDDKKIVMVETRILDDGKPDIKIGFKLRRNSKTGEWSAYDMIAEGVSVLDSKRAELQGLIRQQGLDSVSDLLIEKAEKPIVKKDLGSNS